MAARGRLPRLPHGGSGCQSAALPPSRDGQSRGMVTQAEGLTLALDGHERRPELEPSEPVNTRAEPVTLDPPRGSWTGGSRAASSGDSHAMPGVSFVRPKILERTYNV